MVHSMTGFGTHRGPLGAGDVEVTLRAVNGRYFKLSLRLPEHLLPLEREIEEAVKASVHRGSVTLTVRELKSVAPPAMRVNRPLALSLLRDMQAVATEANLPAPSLDALLSLPGIVEQDWGTRADVDDAEEHPLKKPLLAVIAMTLNNFQATRQAEGEKLAADLSARLAVMRRCHEALTHRAPLAVEEYRAKFEERVSTLLKGSPLGLEPDVLIREAAMFADRSDIAEELTRLAHHTDTFAEALAGNGPVGRRLDFIAQEMLREVNTIGSKCNDNEMITTVLDLKAEIEKIKEQVQNIE